MKDRVKPLSFHQARNCETARELACKCRCGGVMHGAARGEARQMEFRGFYERLEDEDPHRIPSAKERKELQQLRGTRASLVRARGKWPESWTKEDEINLSRVEKETVRLERVVLGIHRPEA